MTNSITKNVVVRNTAGVGATPYVPAIPARSAYEMQSVCGFRRVSSTGSAITGDLTGSALIWVCEMKPVLVRYPGSAEILATPGIPAVTSTDYNLGWNAGGRSLSIFTGDAAVQFQVRTNVVGAIVGMNLGDAVDGRYNGNTIDHAFMLTQGVALIVENGVTVASPGVYSDATIFKITRTGTTIVYMMDGTTVRTSTGASTASGWLEAALYAGGDEVFNPSLTQISAADTTAQTATIAITLPRLTVFSADGNYAEMAAVLPPATVDAAAGLAAPNFAILNAILPPLAVQGFGLTGEIGSIAITLAPLQVFSSTDVYAELNAVLLPVELYLADEPTDRAFAPELLVYSADTSAESISDVTVTETLTYSVAMSADAVDDITVTETITYSVAMSASGATTEDVDASDSFTLSVQMLEPGADTDVWVTNIEGGSTKYVNFPFNSFAKIGDSYYGAALGGVYKLGGSTDAGAPIRAVLSPGKLDFGNPAKKTLSHALLGLACTGVMTMKVKALDSAGASVEYLYSTTRPSAALREARIKCGKGLRANFHSVELYNVDGADFELASMQFEVADMKRKI